MKQKIIANFKVNEAVLKAKIQLVQLDTKLVLIVICVKGSPLAILTRFLGSPVVGTLL